MNNIPGPGGSNETKSMTVDEFVAHATKELANDGNKFDNEWAYSINDKGEVEILFYNGMFVCSKEEFEELKRKTPNAQWKQYPNDWAHDEIEEVISYLHARDLVDGLKDDHDYDGALKTLMIYLGADPQDAGDGLPPWIRDLPREELKKLATGVLLVLGITPGQTESATDLVDRMLDS